MYIMLSEASEPSGSPKVETLKYAVRITLLNKDKKSAFALCDKYNKRWKTIEWLWCYEISKEDTPHIHGYVTMENEYATSSMSEWMSKQIENKKGRSMYNHQEIEDEGKYAQYVLKDGEYITNMKKERVDELLKLVEKVQKSMKMSGFQKLLLEIKPALDAIDEYNSTIPDDDFLPDEEEKMPDICSGKNGKMINKSNVKGCQLMAYPNPNIKKNIVKKQKIEITLSDIAERIVDIYINKWDKPPPWMRLNEYAIYVATKCGHCGEEIKNNIKNKFVW